MKKIFVLLCVALAVWSCNNAPEKPSASLNSEVQQLRDEVADLKQQLNEKNDDGAKTDAKKSAPQTTALQKMAESENDSFVSYLYLWGSIGGYDDCTLQLENGKGTVSVGDGIRRVSVKSYSRRTGQLVLNAYYTNGKYIGQYVGSYNPRNDTYVGVFHNKKGTSVRFDLYQGGE